MKFSARNDVEKMVEKWVEKKSAFYHNLVCKAMAIDTILKNGY